MHYTMERVSTINVISSLGRRRYSIVVTCHVTFMDLKASILHTAKNCVFSSVWQVGAVSNRTDTPTLVGAIFESRLTGATPFLLESIITDKKRNISQPKV